MSYRVGYHSRSINFHSPKAAAFKERTMAKVTSDVSTSAPFGALPDDTYQCVVSKIEDKKSNTKPDGTGGNPMFVIDFKVANDPNHQQFNNRDIRFYNLVYGGRDKNGDPNSIGRVLDFITAVRTPWDHLKGPKTADACGIEDISKAPMKDTKQGMYLCPECNVKIETISYDPALWQDRPVKVMTRVEKAFKSDRDVNSVVAVLPV